MMVNKKKRHIDPKDTIQKRLAGQRKPDWKIALICFRPYQDSQNIIKRLKAEPLAYRLFCIEEFPDTPRVYQTTLNDVGIVILRGQFVGGPLTSSIMEELAVVGIKTVVGQGIAGSLNKSIVIGDQVVCLKALNTDGTSKFYIDNQKEVMPDRFLANVVRASGAELDIEIKEAAVATVDAFYQETDEMIQQWQSQGADIMNMEVTPVYSIARYYGLSAIWLGYISDSIFSQTNFKYGNEVREQCDLICIRTLEKLSINQTG